MAGLVFGVVLAVGHTGYVRGYGTKCLKMQIVHVRRLATPMKQKKVEKTVHEIRKQEDLKRRKKAEKVREDLKKQCWTCWKDYKATKCTCSNALLRMIHKGGQDVKHCSDDKNAPM